MLFRSIRLRRAGFEIPGIAYLERPVDDADPTGARARFARLPLPDAPEGRIQLIQHLTRDAIWQERLLSHPNGAVALDAVILAVADPAEVGARFSRLSGQPAVPDPLGGFALDLPRGRVRLLPEDQLEKVFLGVAAPVVPFIAGISLRTADRAAAITRAAGFLRHDNHPFRCVGSRDASFCCDACNSGRTIDGAQRNSRNEWYDRSGNSGKNFRQLVFRQQPYAPARQIKRESAQRVRHRRLA